MKGSKNSIHKDLLSRIWWVLMVAVAAVFLVLAYHFSYVHGTPTQKRDMDSLRSKCVRLIPNYHPKKNTKGTKKAQNSEQQIKKKIRENH